MQEYAIIALANGIVVLLLLAALEGTLVVLLKHPPPATLVLRVLSSFYTEHDRRIIQALPECARYDPELAYVLRPGTCRFRNYDFDTEVAVNRMGLRDDDDSLIAPEIIALGDSFTMGWGVQVSEAYPSIVENTCSRKVLNAGISSYGTVRALALLRRIDLSAVEVLLIQYSDNDYEENRLYKERGNQLMVMNEKSYTEMQRMHLASLEYYPGRYIRKFIPFVADRIGRRFRAVTGAPARVQNLTARDRNAVAADQFLHTLATVTPLAPETRIIAFRMNGRDKNTPGFSKAVRAALRKGEYQAPIRSLEVLEFSSRLTRDKFFRLDDHTSPAGHLIAAEEIGQALGCGEPRNVDDFDREYSTT